MKKIHKQTEIEITAQPTKPKHERMTTPLRIDCATSSEIPSAEQIRKIVGPDNHLVLQFPADQTVDKAPIIAKLSYSRPECSVFDSGGDSKTQRVTVKRVGVTSNSHKAIVNVLEACGECARKNGKQLTGVKVGGEGTGKLFNENPGVRHVEDNPDGRGAYNGGVVGGTAWLFARPEWEGALDFLFVDEAGQVPLANVIAVSRSGANLILLGDQMQLEQPIQGSHPGDAGLSALQYALKDVKMSQPDSPVFHAVIPNDYGIFLGESRRMHPSVCSFISDSIYEGRLKSHADCANQKIACPPAFNGLVKAEHGILFFGVAHDGNTQRSDEEVVQIKRVFAELLGRQFIAKDGTVRPLTLDDFLFVAPYNAQVRALTQALPNRARVGSVDKFQGQESPVCIISLCSSFGEYGSRGLSFILDRNRINVAISRAKCLAIVVADPRIAMNEAGTIEEMILTNLFCKIVRVGTTQPENRLIA